MLKCFICRKEITPGRTVPLCSLKCQAVFVSRHIDHENEPKRNHPCSLCPYRKSSSGWVTSDQNELNKFRLQKGLVFGCVQAITFEGNYQRCCGRDLMDIDPEFFTTEEFFAHTAPDDEDCREEWYRLTQETGLQRPKGNANE